MNSNLINIAGQGELVQQNLSLGSGTSGGNLIVPSGERWKPISLLISVRMDSAVSTRKFRTTFGNGVDFITENPCNASLQATDQYIITWGTDLPHNQQDYNGIQYVTCPMNEQWLDVGAFWFIQTTGIQVGDFWQQVTFNYLRYRI